MKLRELHTLNESKIEHVLYMMDGLMKKGWSPHLAICKILDQMGIKDKDDRLTMRAKIDQEVKKRQKQRRQEKVKKVPSYFVL